MARYVNVALDKTFVKNIDALIKKGKYQNRPDFLREATREKLRQIEAEGI